MNRAAAQAIADALGGQAWDSGGLWLAMTSRRRRAANKEKSPQNRISGGDGHSALASSRCCFAGFFLLQGVGIAKKLPSLAGLIGR